jgi:3alpha(or 20beta)-hydroxysteroid dehydrogenase
MGALERKVAIVTGAARGIGAEIGRLFAAEGAAVVLADRRDELGEAVAEEIRKAGGRALYLHLDITSSEEWHAAVATASAEFGGVDVLVNNAGIIRVKPFLETSLEDLQKVLNTNLIGGYLGTQCVVPAMKARGGGSVVNFSSVQGIEGREGFSAYAASKFAVRGLGKTLAIELGPDAIRVNTIFPGPTRTKMTERSGWSDDQYNEAYRGYPLGRMARPEEIAQMALFLASEASSFCTGGEFVVDGGVTAGKPRS